MSSVVPAAILAQLNPMAFSDEDSLVNFHKVHIPQLLELVLKQN